MIDGVWYARINGKVYAFQSRKHRNKAVRELGGKSIAAAETWQEWPYEAVYYHQFKQWLFWAKTERQKRLTAAPLETNMFDKVEEYPNCTVQVLTNTTTGETSVGWWRNEG